MIKNERQYRITRAHLEKFLQAADNLSFSGPNPLRQAQAEALRAQAEDLRAAIQEYESLRDGQVSILEVNSFDELPLALVRARIACGLSQRQLAERLGIKEQQIQQYESSNYASASFDRLRKIIQALGLVIHDEIFLPVAGLSREHLVRRLAQIGLDPTFYLRRILPAPLYARLEQATTQEQAHLTLQAASLICRVFNWRPSSIFADTALSLDPNILGSVRFKLPARTSESKVSAYSVYVHYIALLAAHATPHLTSVHLSADAAQVRSAIMSYGGLTFENALRYIWDQGVVVLPLADRVSFHGACWRVNGRNLLIIKQNARFTARWLYDLLHEYYHATQEPDQQERSVIEAGDILKADKSLPEEVSAQLFAENVIFDGQADRIAEKCAVQSQHVVAKLKAAVQRVAREESVPIDALAYHLAYRLSLEGVDWWGAATNLQDRSVDPFHIARRIFLERVDVRQLNVSDRGILLQALMEDQE